MQNENEILELKEEEVSHVQGGLKWKLPQVALSLHLIQLKAVLAFVSRKSMTDTVAGSQAMLLFIFKLRPTPNCFHSEEEIVHHAIRNALMSCLCA
jgi:hypothetical protein